MYNELKGNDKKKHAELYVNNIWLGRVVYYYWSETSDLIKLYNKNMYMTAQFFKDKVKVVLEEENIEDKAYEHIYNKYNKEE